MCHLWFGLLLSARTTSRRSFDRSNYDTVQPFREEHPGSCDHRLVRSVISYRVVSYTDQTGFIGNKVECLTQATIYGSVSVVKVVGRSNRNGPLLNGTGKDNRVETKEVLNVS